MRLFPIDRPKSLLMKLAFFFSKRQYGKVLAPLRFIYSRSRPVMMASLVVAGVDKKLRLSAETNTLIRYYAASLNGCSFCADLKLHTAQKERLELEHLKEVLNFRDNPRFSEKEKSLLAYLEEVNFNKAATDATFEALKQHFTDEEIVEITWVNASENYFNLLAKPLGLTSDELFRPAGSITAER